MRVRNTVNHEFESQLERVELVLWQFRATTDDAARCATAAKAGSSQLAVKQPI